MKKQKVSFQFYYERNQITVDVSFIQNNFEFKFYLGCAYGLLQDLSCELLVSDFPNTIKAQAILLNQPKYLPFAKKMAAEILVNCLPNYYQNKVLEKTKIVRMSTDSLNDTLLNGKKISIIVTNEKDEEKRILYHLKQVIVGLNAQKSFKLIEHKLAVFHKTYKITDDGYANFKVMNCLRQVINEEKQQLLDDMLVQTPINRQIKLVETIEKTIVSYQDPTLIYLKPFVASNSKAMKILESYL
jgi:hypothetical protein